METTSGKRGSILFAKYSSCLHLLKYFSETKSEISHLSENHFQHSHMKQLVRGNWNQDQDVKHQGRAVGPFSMFTFIQKLL